MESGSIRKALSNYNYLVNSTKSFHGHTLGAAGLLEIIITIIELKNNEVYGNIGIEDNFDFHYPKFYVNKNIKWGISNSFAFGGNATSVLISK